VVFFDNTLGHVVLCVKNSAVGCQYNCCFFFLLTLYGCIKKSTTAHKNTSTDYSHGKFIYLLHRLAQHKYPTKYTKKIIPQHIPGYPPPHFHMNLPPQYYGYQPQHPQNYMHFGGQGSYHQSMTGPQPSYQQHMASGSHLGAPYHDGQYPAAFPRGGMLGGLLSPVGSSAFFGVAGGSNSRGDDSGSPMSRAPYSPISPAEYNNQHVREYEGSDDGEEPRGAHQRWSKQQICG
jgi:hypothetical protein